MEIKKIISMHNEENKNLEEIGKVYGKSKSTIQRFIKSNNYCLNKKTGKYEINVSRETINNENNVSCETNTSNETMVNRTYAISENIDRAIKIKAAIENKKPIDIVREALDAFIDKKYLELK